VVGLDRSTYYDIKYHTPSDREIRHLLLTDAIADVHTRSRSTYGMLRIKPRSRSSRDSLSIES